MAEGARAEILARIASATAGVRDDAPDVDADAPRAYRHEAPTDEAARLTRLAERLEDYGVEVMSTRSDGLAGDLAAALAKLGAREVVVPDGLPEAWLAQATDVRRIDERAGPRALDAADATVSACAVAVAETGSLVLDGGAGQGRRAATLIPDVHLCVVPASHVVSLVPQAVARLAPAVRAGRPLTWISGPSATSDIELVRVGGVHGPRTLVVLLVEGA